jgi:transposase-like protein
MKRTWTDKELVEAVRGSISIADTLRKIGLVPKGGNYRTLQKVIQEMKLNTSHWLGMAHLRGKKRKLPCLPLSEILIVGSEYGRSHIKERVLKEGLLKNECAMCGQGSEWKGKQLMLTLDHINGVNNDNRIENLRLLCPNCNSQTDTFCGRKNRGIKKIEHIWKCQDCGQKITREAKWCRPCSRKRSRKVERPSLESLLKDRETMTMDAVGRKYGVTGNAVKKWIRQAQELR